MKGGQVDPATLESKSSRRTSRMRACRSKTDPVTSWHIQSSRG
jgi:hypothetical protein